MRLDTFGKVQIFRPRIETELAIRHDSSSQLRSKFKVGKYSDKGEINAILQDQFAFYSTLLAELLPPVASHHFLEFLLYQYDLYSEIEKLYRRRGLNAREDARWGQINGILRRAVKYIAERVVMLAPDEAPAGDEATRLEETEKIWICAEEMVNLYMSSDSIFSIFPEDTVLEIFPPGEPFDYHFETTRDCPIQARVRLDTANRQRFVPEPSMVFDTNEHNKVIGTALESIVGVNYQEALKIIANIIEFAQPDPNGFPVPFIHKDRVVEGCAESFGHDPDVVRRVIAGFTISKAQLETEGREIWKPKQEYRAYRRGFFEMPHPTGTHLIFSKEMAKECFVILTKGAVFNQLPMEWRGQTVSQALSRLSNATGTWFEKVVEENFKKVGLFGVRSAKDGIGIREARLAIPPDVGEIDFIGYSVNERLLVVGECKLVRDSSEPKLFRDDLSDFVSARGSYIEKFQKKIGWVRANLAPVCRALESAHKYGTSVAPERVAGVIITFLPTIAACFIYDYPCVSLTELMLEYESKRQWPYDFGIHNDNTTN